jgi:hypothetical protein
LIHGFSVSAWHIVSKITDREYGDVNGSQVVRILPVKRDAEAVSDKVRQPLFLFVR